MYAEFFLAKDWRLHCYGLGATALLIQLANAYLAVQINAWIARLYDTLQLCVTAPEQAAPQLAPLGWEFVVFSLPWATLAPASQYVMKRWALAWREALTEARTLERGVADYGVGFVASSAAEIILRRILALAIHSGTGSWQIAEKIEELPTESPLSYVPESLLKEIMEQVKNELKVAALAKQAA